MPTLRNYIPVRLFVLAILVKVLLKQCSYVMDVYIFFAEMHVATTFRTKCLKHFTILFCSSSKGNFSIEKPPLYNFILSSDFLKLKLLAQPI